MIAQTPEAQREDLRELLALPHFRRFLFRILEQSGICGASFGSEVHVLQREGARSLGSEILRWVSEAHPVQEHPGLPVNALLTILTEVSASTPTAKDSRNAPQKPPAYDRFSDLDDGERAP